MQANFLNNNVRLLINRTAVCARINKIVRYPIYGDQNQMAQAVAVVQNSTLGRIYKSASTFFVNWMAQAVTFER